MKFRTDRILVLSCVVVAITFLPSTVAAQGAAEKGAAVFAAQKCTMCHSMDGKGNPKGPLDAIGSKWKADEIRQWITTPVEMAAKHNATRKPAMKSFATLPKEDLDALVAFLSSKKKS